MRNSHKVYRLENEAWLIYILNGCIDYNYNFWERKYFWYMWQ